MWIFNAIVKILHHINDAIVANGQKQDLTNAKLDELIKLLTPPPDVAGFDPTIDTITKQ